MYMGTLWPAVTTTNEPMSVLWPTPPVSAEQPELGESFLFFSSFSVIFSMSSKPDSTVAGLTSRISKLDYILTVLDRSPLVGPRAQPRTSLEYIAKTTHPLIYFIHHLASRNEGILLLPHAPPAVWLDPVGCSEGSAEFPNNPCSASRSGPQLSSQRTGTSRTHIYIVINMWNMVSRPLEA